MICIFYWESDEFAGVKVTEATTSDAMPEELVNGSNCILFARHSSKRRLVNVEQPFALTRLGGNQCFHANIPRVARFDRTYEVKHDWPMYHRINDHLLLFFMQYS